jgi:hypothetical protein
MDNTPKKLRFRTVLKYLLFSISALIYIVIFSRLFVACDSKIADKLYLGKSEKELYEDLSVELALEHYQPTAWTSEDGSVQIKNIHYIKDFENLQLTVRSRDDVYNPNSDTYPFTFKIRVVGESETELSPEFFTDTRFGYTYARLVCEGVLSEHGEKVLYDIETFDEKGNSVISTETEIKGGNEIFLDIYNLSGERLYTFEIAGKNVNHARIRRKTVDVIELK